MYFIVNKVLYNDDASSIEKRLSIECLGLYSKKYEAISYLKALKHLTIFNEDIILNSEIHTEMITNKDIDGYHLIRDDNEHIHKYNIYQKQSKTIKGYIYNSVDINIKYVGFIEIVEYSSNIRRTPIKKRIVVEESESEEYNSDEEYLNQLTKRPRLTINKKSEEENNHIYVELNDKLIAELKEKLEKLSMKKNN